MKKKTSIFSKPSTTIACVALTGLLATGALAGCGTASENGQLSNVASSAQGTGSTSNVLPEAQTSPVAGGQTGSEPVCGKLPSEPMCGLPLAPKESSEPAAIPEPMDDPCRPPAPKKDGKSATEEPAAYTPKGPQTKIDLSKCESYTSIPFRVTDANGKELAVEVFPEYWNNATYCTTGHRYAFEHKFQDKSKHPDQIADHARLTVDFGKYVPQKLRVTRDVNTYDVAANRQEVEMTEVPSTISDDGKFTFTADFGTAQTLYYLISAEWDGSHVVDYAIAVRKA